MIGCMSTNTVTQNVPLSQAAKVLGISRGALQVRIHRGTFPLEPIRYAEGGRRYFRGDEVLALAKGGLQGLEEFRAANQ